MVGANDNEEFVQEFLVESTENLDQLDRDLIALEQAPGDEERLASIFRTVHTIKGNSGFFGFAKLQLRRCIYGHSLIFLHQILILR